MSTWSFGQPTDKSKPPEFTFVTNTAHPFGPSLGIALETDAANARSGRSSSLHSHSSPGPSMGLFSHTDSTGGTGSSSSPSAFVHSRHAANTTPAEGGDSPATQWNLSSPLDNVSAKGNESNRRSSQNHAANNFSFGQAASPEASPKEFTFRTPTTPNQRPTQATQATQAPLFSFLSPTPNQRPAQATQTSPLSSLSPTPSSPSSTPGRPIRPLSSRSKFPSSSATPLENHMRSLSMSSSPAPVTGPDNDTVQTESNEEAANDSSIISTTESVPIPYDALKEPMPRHQFYTSAVQRAIQAGLSYARMAEKATENLGNIFPLDESAKRLLTGLKGLKSLPTTENRRIAILGDSGEGKSSLINSLLHCPGIAKTGDIGSACTSVVTEYRQKRPQDTAPITIEVEYLSKAGIDEHISELLWSYRQLYLPIVESSATSAEDYTRLQRESDQAWSALQAAFAHKREFSKQYLRNQDEGAYERIKEQLCQWSCEIQWPTDGESGNESGVWKSVASTAEEGCEKTRVFMEDRYWPFTKVIRVYLSSQVLKTGTVLADLPGLQDTNLARVRATQEYLLKCDNIFIVAKISRAITSQSIKSSLFYVLSRHMPMEWEQSGGKGLKIAVVCTTAEDINIKSAKTEFCGRDKRLSSEVIKRLEDEVKAAKTADDRPRKKEAKERLKFAFVKARNAHVREGLQQAYSSEVANSNLNVFCVSNTMYEKYCRKGKNEFVQDSGIPEVRQFCHNITAGAQMQYAKHVLQTELAGHLNSLILWANSHRTRTVHETRKSDEPVQKAVETMLRMIPESAAAVHRMLMASFQEQLGSFLDQRGSHWESAAISKASEWESWHWMQYNTWCIHNGNHATENRDRADWNAEIIWKMRMELDYSWELVIDEIPDHFETLRSGLVSSLEELKEVVRACMGPQQVTLLIREIDYAVSSLKYKTGLVEQYLIGEIGYLRRRATDSSEYSYILGEMTPSYRAASSQSGGGKAHRQRSIVGGHIRGGTLFANIAISLTEDMSSLAEKTEADLKKDIAPIFDGLRQNFDMTLQSAREHYRVSANTELQNNSLEQFENEIQRLKDDLDGLGPLEEM